MKKLIIMFGTLLVIAASCTINQTFVYDDGYYTALQHQNAMIERQSRANLATQNVPVAEAAPAVEQVYLDENSDYSTTSSYMTDDGATYVTNNYYFNGDNYYDYEYTARLRRFYGVNYGWSYYDPYFTNQYWYNYNPACWGVSIYYGYNFWWDDPWYYRPYYYRPHYYYSRSTIVIIILAAAIVRMVLEVIIITTTMTEIMLSSMDTAIQFKEASMLSIVVAVAKAAIEAEAQLTTTSKLLANAMKQQWEALLLHAAE